jgi:hypothetical protein
MKQFLDQQRNRIWMKALYSSTIISLSLYIIIRAFSFDFPMSWMEEIMLFLKIVCTGSVMMVVATIGCAGLYKSFLRMKRNKKTGSASV